MASNNKKAKAPLTEDQEKTFAEAEKAAKAVQPSPASTQKKAPKKVTELSNGMKRIDS